MIPRTNAQMTTQELLEAVASSPLQWPWKSKRFARNSLQDYRQRSLSAHISVAELYHENSKLFPEMLCEITASLTSVEKCRDEFLQRRADVARGTASLQTEFPPRLREILTNVGQYLPPQLFYAVELRVLTGQLIALFEPISDMIQVFRKISAEELMAVNRALKLLEPSGEPKRDDPALFVVAFFARNDILFGPRGYRRTLLEAGQIIQRVISVSANLGWNVTPIYEFADRDVDCVLGADGTEEGVIAALVIPGA